MNGISCATELILAEIDEKMDKSLDFGNIVEWLHVIKRSALTLSQMIQNMLLFSKVQFLFTDTS